MRAMLGLNAALSRNHREQAALRGARKVYTYPVTRKKIQALKICAIAMEVAAISRLC